MVGSYAHSSVLLDRILCCNSLLYYKWQVLKARCCDIFFLKGVVQKKSCENGGCTKVGCTNKELLKLGCSALSLLSLLHCTDTIISTVLLLLALLHCIVYFITTAFCSVTTITITALLLLHYCNCIVQDITIHY